MLETNTQAKTQHQAYRLAHREQQIARCRAYYLAHQEEQRAKQRAYHQAHREEENTKSRVRNRAYHQAHQGERKVKGQAYREAHPQEQKAYRQAYQLTHPEEQKARKLKRRALMAGVAHQPYKVADIIERDRGICGLCGKKVAKADRSIDHILPLSLGGADAPHNVQLAHRQCNVSKHNTARFPSNLRLAL